MTTPPKNKKPVRQPPRDPRREPPPPKTDDPAKDKAEMEDGVLQPLPGAD